MSTDTTAAPASAAEAPSTQQAPAAEAQQTTPEQPKQKLTPAERKAELVERLKAGKARKQAERQGTAPGPSSEPVEATDNDETQADDKAPEKPKVDKPAEPDRELELRVAKLSRELRDAKSDAIEWKPKAEKFDALMGKFEKSKGDPYAAVQLLPELFGMDFGQMADFVVKNADKFQESKRYADLPPDVREEVELARKERAERQEREKKATEEQQNVQRFTSYKTKVQSFLEQNADDYPLASALEWAAGDVAASCLRGNTKDALPVLRELEDTLRKNLSGAISNERVLKALATDKELRAKIVAALGPTQEPKNRPLSGSSLQNGATEQRSGSATLTNRSTSSDTTAPQGRPSKEERRNRMAEAIRLQWGR